MTPLYNLTFVSSGISARIKKAAKGGNERLILKEIRIIPSRNF